MASHALRSRAATLVAFAIATAGATLAVAWPTSTHADGAPPIATFAVDGWKIGDVIAKGELLQDARGKAGWVILVTAKNSADHAEVVPLETDVTRLSTTPISRVLPLPQTVWSTRETVRVPAHGTVVLHYVLPGELGASIAAAQAPKAAVAPGVAFMTPVVSFAVAFDRQRAEKGRPSQPPAVAN